MDRAYSLLHVKSVDAEQRIIGGVATTPSPDRADDVVDPLGVKFATPLPLLLHHDQKSPVGEVRFGRPTKEGIPFTAQLPKVTEPGTVRDRVDEAWHSAKYGLLRGASIGFVPLDAPQRRKTGGLHFTAIEVVELSLVAVPMNSAASITSIKSLDTAQLAALGTRSQVAVPARDKGLTTRSAMNVPLSEQIADVQSTIKEKSTRLEELIGAEDESLKDEERVERSGLNATLKSLTERLTTLRTLEAAQLAQVVDVTHPAPREIAKSHGTGNGNGRTKVEIVKSELPKGTRFIRYAMSVAAGKGSYSDTLAYAKRFTDTPEVSLFVKALWDQKAVEGTSVVQSPGWGGELVTANTAMTEFVELLMPETIIGKVPNFRRVPFNIPIITQTGGSTFEWVDEGAVKPVGELAFVRDVLGHSKCAGIIVMTEELIRLSSPSAEARARADMIEQCRKFLDEQFIQVGITAGTTSPASITNGVASPAASGTGVEELKADLLVAFGVFTAASVPLTGLVIVMTPDLALGISMLTNTLGQTPAGFNVTPTGGTLMGFPVIVSESVDAGHIVIFKPSEIFLADDGQVRLDASNQATLDMNGGSSPTFNLWQRNCVGLRAERWINWKKRRDSVVAVIDTAAYAPTT